MYVYSVYMFSLYLFSIPWNFSRNDGTRNRRYKFSRIDDRDVGERRNEARARQEKGKGIDEEYNSADDDGVGRFLGKPGERITDRYRIIKDAGVGTFGRVIECFDRKLKRNIAMKMVRSVPKYLDGARIEADILKKINRIAREKKLKRNLVSHHVSMSAHIFFLLSSLYSPSLLTLALFYLTHSSSALLMSVFH